MVTILLKILKLIIHSLVFSYILYFFTEPPQQQISWCKVEVKVLKIVLLSLGYV